MKANDYRRAGRYAAQDKARREQRHALAEAEDAYLAARESYHAELANHPDGPERSAASAYRTAEDALYALDPHSPLLT